MPAVSVLASRDRVVRLGGALAGLALVVAAFRPAPPPRELPALADALGVAIAGAVSPDDIRWEPSHGALDDYAFGRWVVFLGAKTAGAPRDVWRARVRLTPEGRPVEVAETHDLTSTPLGDDHGLVLAGTRAAFATFAYGQEQSVTSLDLGGEDATQIVKAHDRAMAWVTNVQQTGTGAGVGRVDVTLDPPAKRAALHLDAEGKVVLALTYDDGTREARLDPSKAEVTNGLHAEAQRHLPKPVVFWAVDTVRAVPWIGPAPIAWLEDQVFGLRDTAKQLAFKLHASDPEDTLADPAVGTPPAAKVLDTSKISADDGAWPPTNIPSIWKSTEPGEGEWAPPKLPWMRKLAEDAPPAFVRTFVRPDQERPYAEVLLVAMDMRQLELDMEAGSEDPKPLVGANGPGRIPRDAPTYTRVVAAFNGGFKTEHGNYGMMVKKRVLLPPQPGAATVAVLKDGRVGFGTWANTHEITGIKDVADADIVSFRQNLDPLVDHGEVNPTKRGLWGWTMPGTGVQTERSGVCTTTSGHIIYAWGEDVSATTLGKAMNMAGCSYGLHLDMNPHHTGFIFATIEELKGRKYHSELLAPGKMEISPDRYIEYAPKDFFYVLLHDPTPVALASGTASATSWTPDAGTQPAPSWVPGIWTAKISSAEGVVELTDVEAGRATFRVRGGAREPDPKTGAAPLTDLGEADAARVLFATGLGVAEEKRPRGLATGGKLVMPMHGGAGSAALVASADGTLSIVRAEEVGEITPGQDFAEVPLLLDRGEPIASSHPRSTVGSASRAALGITAEGRVLLARGLVLSDAPLADALKRAGCIRAVLLDRGARATPFVDRAGGASPPRARYDVSVLYAVAKPMKPRSFRFEPQTTLAQAK